MGTPKIVVCPLRFVPLSTTQLQPTSSALGQLEADFPSDDLYNDYLEEREDIILKLTGPSSQAEVQDAWRQVESYKQKNQEQILRSQGAQMQHKAPLRLVNGKYLPPT